MRCISPDTLIADPLDLAAPTPCSGTAPFAVTWGNIHAHDAGKDRSAGIAEAGGRARDVRQPRHDGIAADGRVRGGAGASLRPGVAGSARDGHGGRLRPGVGATGRASTCMPRPGLGNAMGMLYDAQKAGSPILVTAGQHEQRFNFTEPLLWADLPDDRPPVREMVGGSAPAGGSAAGHPSRREDRAGAADRAGVPVAAGRYPDRQRGSRPGHTEPGGARHPRRCAGDRAGRRDHRQGAAAR